MQTVNTITLQQKQELYDKLEKHDWFYMMADDGKAYRRGEVAHSQLYAEVKGMGDEAQDLYESFQKYMNSLVTSTPLPKPLRPGGDRAKPESLGLWF